MNGAGTRVWLVVMLLGKGLNEFWRNTLRKNLLDIVGRWFLRMVVEQLGYVKLTAMKWSSSDPPLTGRRTLLDLRVLLTFLNGHNDCTQIVGMIDLYVPSVHVILSGSPDISMYSTNYPFHSPIPRLKRTGNVEFFGVNMNTIKKNCSSLGWA